MLRVDEFKKQLETMHENLTGSSEKMQELHEKIRMLKELFKRIDQVEVRFGFIKTSLRSRAYEPSTSGVHGFLLMGIVAKIPDTMYVTIVTRLAVEIYSSKEMDCTLYNYVIV